MPRLVRCKRPKLRPRATRWRSSREGAFDSVLGKACGSEELPGFVRSLTSLEAALVRIDLPVGETLKEPPAARALRRCPALPRGGVLGQSPSVDPQMQGQGFMFLLRTNSLRLTSGESVSAPEDPW